MTCGAMGAVSGMKDAKSEPVEGEKAEARQSERPPVELHDPFNRFDFEPTDGGDF